MLLFKYNVINNDQMKITIKLSPLITRSYERYRTPFFYYTEIIRRFLSFFKFSFRQAILRKTLFSNSSEYYTFVTQNEYYA